MSLVSILVVDDDSHIRELINLYLTMEGFNVLQAGDGEEALDIIKRQSIHLAVIDIMMPRKDGWDLCREIREEYTIPIIMLTAKGESEDKVKGFEHGTDDYIVKPFDAKEFVMRTKALLRRSKIHAEKKAVVGNLRIDGISLEVMVNNSPIDLPLKEFQLLYKLATNPGQVFSRDQLIEEIWGIDFYGNERTIDSHIKKIRKKLEEKHSLVKITTIRGLGYRLEAEPRA
ncbi:response regulator transcription factor [Jeotgalibacillus sp. ET6]|uniref:response regulator transcription factor n=1 Tax=Jeotgalibacillus sp. ET6 TaxID=3037260 RepID=UPI002418845F|nr:response regulator transcription factor [Jeotgalibacillus sp. ET6]MDG5473147.1 response regulator transcription factor [Jeotgalibacillus sp. ET6]